MTKEFIKFCNLNNFTEILEFYNNANIQIKNMIENIYKVSYRYALTKNQTKYLIEEAVKSFRNESEKLVGDFL